jgi:hypothetical protein
MQIPPYVFRLDAARYFFCVGVILNTLQFYFSLEDMHLS